MYMEGEPHTPSVRPLIYAAWWGLPPMVKFLVERGACVNAQAPNEFPPEDAQPGVAREGLCSKGERALDVASRRGHNQVVRYLLTVGGDPNLKGELETILLGTHVRLRCSLLIGGGLGS